MRTTDLTDDEIANWVTGRPSDPRTEQGVRMAFELQERRKRAAIRDAEFVALRKALWVRLDEVQAQAARIRQFESAVAADEERVRSVVRETAHGTLFKARVGTNSERVLFADAIATRAAKQLASAASASDAGLDDTRRSAIAALTDADGPAPSTDERARSAVRDAMTAAVSIAKHAWFAAQDAIEATIDEALRQLGNPIATLPPDRLAIVEAFLGGAAYMADHSEITDCGAGPSINQADGSEEAAEAWATHVGAEHLVVLPARKEWSVDAHDRGDPTDMTGSSDYVDGWNDALDAVAGLNELAHPTPTAADRMQPLVDLAIRIRDRRYTIRTSLHREDRALFDELSVAIDAYRKETP